MLPTLPRLISLAISSLFAAPFVHGLAGFSGGPAESIQITLTANAPRTDPGQGTLVKAAVTGDSSGKGVTWAFSEANCAETECGRLDYDMPFSVYYIAPFVVATAQQVSITATSVADPTVKATIVIGVAANLQIATPAGTLVDGKVGSHYTAILSGAGGTPPYTWSVTAGELPEGLALDGSSGEITGVPQASGNHGFAVRLTDAASPPRAFYADFTIKVADAPITWSTPTLPAATVGNAYKEPLDVDGGAGQLTFGVAIGKLPPGLVLSPGGVLSGTPTEVGASDFTLHVFDQYGDNAYKEYALHVYSPVNIVTPFIPVGFTGGSYSSNLYAYGGSGKFAWTVLTGAEALQASGITLSAGGELTGTPAAAGSNTFTAQVKDLTTGGIATGLYVLTVNSGSVSSCPGNSNGKAALNPGYYSFNLQGTDENGNLYDEAGTLRANADGTIAQGNRDAVWGINDGMLVQGQDTFTGTLGLDGSQPGLLTLINANPAAVNLPTETKYCFYPYKQGGTCIEADSSGRVEIGQVDSLGPNPPGAIPLDQPYIFYLHGGGPSADERSGAVGQLQFEPDGFLGGVLNLWTNNSGTGVYTGDVPLESGSGYTMDSTGMLTMTLELPGATIHVNGFPVTIYPSKMKFNLLGWGDGIGSALSGEAAEQTTTPFTESQFAGKSFVFEGAGSDPTANPPKNTARVGWWTMDGMGHEQVIGDGNYNGTIELSPGVLGTGLDTVKPDGEVTLNYTLDPDQTVEALFSGTTQDDVAYALAESGTVYRIVPQAFPPGFRLDFVPPDDLADESLYTPGGPRSSLGNEPTIDAGLLVLSGDALNGSETVVEPAPETPPRVGQIFREDIYGIQREIDPETGRILDNWPGTEQSKTRGLLGQAEWPAQSQTGSPYEVFYFVSPTEYYMIEVIPGKQSLVHHGLSQ